MPETRYWIGVVSREHVLYGVAQGIAQLNHGKREPLARMHPGDWLAYYSPRTSYPDGDPLQAFTAIGQITSPAPYAVEMSADFHPFRVDITYYPSRPVPIKDLLDQLTFIPDPKHWGSVFRFGQLKVTRADFATIASAMGVTLPD